MSVMAKPGSGSGSGLGLKTLDQIRIDSMRIPKDVFFKKFRKLGETYFVVDPIGSETLSMVRFPKR